MRPFALAIAVPVLLLFAACGGGGSTTASPTPGGATGSLACTDLTTTDPGAIAMQDFVFVPDCVVALNTQALTLSNDGTALHNFSLAHTSIDVDVQPGESRDLQPPGAALAPGTYAFFCKYHRSQGMQGIIRVDSGPA